MRPDDERPWIVALLIGELRYMTQLNRVTTRIVEHAVSDWRAHPSTLLICEAEPMAVLAASLGVPRELIRTAIPEAGGHTTRWAAERVRAMADSGSRSLRLVTHRLHAPRAARMFRALKMQVELEGLDLPFDRDDPDWKLRSESAFRAYNMAASAYCLARGWMS